MVSHQRQLVFRGIRHPEEDVILAGSQRLRDASSRGRPKAVLVNSAFNVERQGDITKKYCWGLLWRSSG